MPSLQLTNGLNPTLLIAAFGVLGVLSRWGLDRALGAWSGSFPVSTLVVNILGCAVACGEPTCDSPAAPTLLNYKPKN